MDKVKRLWRDLSLKKSITICIFVFAVLAIVLSTATSALCDYAENKINELYPTIGEKYYLTNENGEQLGEGTYISKQRTPLNKKDERLISVLEFLPLAATPVYSALCIIAAALFFYRSKLKEPLASLRTASEKISNNDLDFQINYLSNDELGQLCNSFEIMRCTLADNFSKMWRQVEERKRLNAAFAHDLRTPLTVLKGYDEMLQASEDTMTQETAQTMAKHILRLERYVDSMSTLSRLEDAKPKRDDSGAKEHIEALIESAEILCGQRGKKLKVQNEVADVSMCVDWSFISQVSNNLVSNAIRYAVSDIAVTYAGDSTGLSLSVTDDGKGFTKEVLQKATTPYFTEEANHAEHFGLGLYICKMLCEHHGGYLKIENLSNGARVTAFFANLRGCE